MCENTSQVVNTKVGTNSALQYQYQIFKEKLNSFSEKNIVDTSRIKPSVLCDTWVFFNEEVSFLNAADFLNSLFLYTKEMTKNISKKNNFRHTRSYLSFQPHTGLFETASSYIFLQDYSQS